MHGIAARRDDLMDVFGPSPAAYTRRPPGKPKHDLPQDRRLIPIGLGVSDGLDHFTWKVLHRWAFEYSPVDVESGSVTRAVP